MKRLLQRISRMKGKYALAAQHYDLTVTSDPTSGKATAIQWQRLEKLHSQAIHHGVYCLRTSHHD